MSNVIAFPGSKRNTPPQSMEELLGSVEQIRKEHIEYLIDEILPPVFQRCYDEGFDLGDDECLKATSLLVEALRSAMYASANLEHPLHAVIDKAFFDPTDPSLKTIAPDTAVATTEVQLANT